MALKINGLSGQLETRTMPELQVTPRRDSFSFCIAMHSLRKSRKPNVLLPPRDEGYSI